MRRLRSFLEAAVRINKGLEFGEGDLLVAVPICGIKHFVGELSGSLDAQHLLELWATRTGLKDGKQVNGKGTKLSTGQVTVAIKIVRVEGSLDLGVAVRIEESGFQGRNVTLIKAQLEIFVTEMERNPSVFIFEEATS